MPDNEAELREHSDKLADLDRRLVEVNKDVTWSQKLMGVVGLLLLGFLGYTNIYSVPREVSSALRSTAIDTAQSEVLRMAGAATNKLIEVQSLLSSVKDSLSHGDNTNGYIRVGDVLLCWGQCVTNPVQPPDVLEFSFTFPEPFKEAPTITTTILPDSPGTNRVTYAIYWQALNQKTFHAKALERDRSPGRKVRTTINYIAIGK